jgi:hypothetical protein
MPDTQPPDWAPDAPSDWPPRPPAGVHGPAAGSVPDADPRPAAGSVPDAMPDPAPDRATASAPPQAPEAGAPPAGRPVSSAVPQGARPHERPAEPLDRDPGRASPIPRPGHGRRDSVLVMAALVVTLVLGVSGCVYSCWGGF